MAYANYPPERSMGTVVAKKGEKTKINLGMNLSPLLCYVLWYPQLSQSPIVLSAAQWPMP